MIVILLRQACLARGARAVLRRFTPVAVEDDALGAAEGDKAAAFGAADQRQSGLPREIDPQAVKPEREIRIGMPICTVLITISEVSRPVV